MRLIVASLLLVASPLAAQTATPTDAEIMSIGGRLSRWMLAGQVDSAIAHMDPKLVQGMGGRDGIAEAGAGLASDLGKEAEVLMESVTRGKGVPEYWRMVLFTEYDEEPFVWHWVFDDAGLATGIHFTNLGSTPPAE
jgi:hypothetical protein